MKYFTKVVVLFVLLMPLIGHAQQSIIGNLFTADLEQKDLSFNVHFFENGEYCAEISSQETDDIVYTMAVSFGQFLVNDELIVMTDALHDFQMQFLIVGDTLFVKKGFGFMKGKKLYCLGRTSMDDVHIKDLNKDSLRQERELYEVQHKELYELAFGKYKGMYWDCDLSINENHTYVFEFRECQISKGTWERKGNILNLHDPILDCHSYLLVGEKDSVISKVLVGDDTGGRVFKKVQTPTTAQPKSGGFGCSRRR